MKKISPLRLAAFFACLFLLAPTFLRATHNRAGEIQVEQIGACGDYRVRATIITYTKASSKSADRDTLTLFWGDGNFSNVARANGSGEFLGNDIQKNIYIGEHQFAGPARYVVSMTDPNRIKGILNVNPPSSDNIPFHIETVYQVPDCQFGSTNSTPHLLQPPIDVACVGKVFKHNPNAFDPDGDSLSYRLIMPLADQNLPVPNYLFPSQVLPVSSFSLDERTGDMVWITPGTPGEYNVAFVVISWRQLIPGQWTATDSTIRDMQILVNTCDNNPPKALTINELCVIAGDTVEFEVRAEDPDTGQLVRLDAAGGPFVVKNSKAEFLGPKGFSPQPFKSIFRWVTTCDHVADQPYSVIFKATDNFFDSTGLADLKQVKIKVVGPPPRDPQAVSDAGEVEVSWQQPYACEAASDDYFYAFSVWRREGPQSLAPDTCQPGLEGRGYQKLVDSTEFSSGGRYRFLDKSVERGRTYCYRIEGKFARTSFGGYPFNVVESMWSDEICVQLPKDLPVITNVSVEKTGAADGEIEIRWSKPNADDLDTLKNHGPYRYRLFRGDGFGPSNLQPVAGADFSAPNFWQANDTFFVQKGLNTADGPHHYRVDFYVKGEAEPLGSTTVASSVFLKIASTDRKNVLSWSEKVSWDNFSYAVFRKNDGTGLFEKIAETPAQTFIDTGLVNGKNYCYYVLSEGTYAVPGVIDPIFNRSEEACGSPIDTVAPCAPTLAVSNFCTTGAVFDPSAPLENALVWTNPATTCKESSDVVGYEIFYHQGDVVELLATIDSPEDTFFIDQNLNDLAACYFVAAFDSAGNRRNSAIFCVENCPQYELPNAFTPNGDGQNDFFRPRPGWRFIQKIDLKIQNRWGATVFETTDPAIEWDGKNAGGQDLADGTYFFTCRVFEAKAGSAEPRFLSGWIELLRGPR